MLKTMLVAVAAATKLVASILILSLAIGLAGLHAKAETAAPQEPVRGALEAPQGLAAPTVSPAPSAESPSAAPLNQSRVPRELSPWSMFMSADIVVKGVMASLAFASLVTWTILLAKSVQFLLARRRVAHAIAAIAPAHTLAEARVALGQNRSVVGALLGAAIGELRLSSDTLVESSIKQRTESHFAEIIRAEARETRVGMGMLATIGATAPFVGLFGTVWGIMNSFIGISKAQTTNLAVVAPGIAEALLATAIGLVAAIPAVIFYNHFARQSKSYIERVSRAAGTIARLLSRDLDRAERGMISRAAE